MIDMDLLEKIKDELSEDLSRYDGDYDQWSEVVMDCPSNTLDELLRQIPESLADEYYEQHIVPYIRQLGE